MHLDTATDDADVSAIKQVLRQELTLSWTQDRHADWAAFVDTFVPQAAMFPSARPLKHQTLDQFIERLGRLKAEGTLASFEVTPMGCDVRVFGNVAIAFAACELLENGSTVNREVNATILVRDNGAWRIAAQAWDVETATRKIPEDLRTSDSGRS